MSEIKDYSESIKKRKSRKLKHCSTKKQYHQKAPKKPEKPFIYRIFKSHSKKSATFGVTRHIQTKMKKKLDVM